VGLTVSFFDHSHEHSARSRSHPFGTGHRCFGPQSGSSHAPGWVILLAKRSGSLTWTGTNTYLVGSGSRRILVDTGEGMEGYLPLLVSVLSEHQLEIQEVVCTHWHRDHITGARALQRNFPSLCFSKKNDPHDQEILPDILFQDIQGIP
jgi:glyoxylase-like metal-dependent hydrolase (beta-lactamase superfamily II)